VADDLEREVNSLISFYHGDLLFPDNEVCR
jgi:hypothetical protein